MALPAKKSCTFAELYKELENIENDESLWADMDRLADELGEIEINDDDWAELENELEQME